MRRQAAVDGLSIDPWHLAAVLEGLRLRMDGALRIIDRSMILDAARHALGLHQWITAPDFDQEGDVQRAERALDSPSGSSRLLSAVSSMHTWLNQGGGRPPIRAALIRYWTTHRLLRVPVPLTGPKALRAEVPFEVDAWVPIFLDALADEAADGLQLLFDLERSWFAARCAAAAGRRSTSRAAAAIDILAVAPLASATTLAAGLGMAVKNAIALLDWFAEAGIVVEVTRRSKRRLRKPVSLCGEMAANPRLTPLLIGLGLRSFSMNASAVPRVKQRVRAVSVDHCARLARRVMEQSDGAAIRALLDSAEDAPT